MSQLTLSALAAAACLVGHANALDVTDPGSLLVYPEYDNSAGVVTFLTLTNTSESDSVDAHFVYVDGDTCDKVSVFETLAANDTLTLLTSYHNPGSTRGFVYVAAEEGENNRILRNRLIGASRFIDGFTGDHYALRPFAFAGIDPTDNGDGLANLDGVEYERLPAQFLIPNFLGYRPTGFSSKVILIGLSGGGAFNTRADFEIYNDNSSVSSASYTFKCWEKVATHAISPAFRSGYLKSSGHDPLEVLGASAIETGWFRVRGGLATSSAATIYDPAILVAFIQDVRGASASSMPFALGVNSSGSLWATSPDGTH